MYTTHSAAHRFFYAYGYLNRQIYTEYSNSSDNTNAKTQISCARCTGYTIIPNQGIRFRLRRTEYLRTQNTKMRTVDSLTLLATSSRDMTTNIYTMTRRTDSPASRPSLRLKETPKTTEKRWSCGFGACGFLIRLECRLRLSPLLLFTDFGLV